MTNSLQKRPFQRIKVLLLTCSLVSGIGLFVWIKLKHKPQNIPTYTVKRDTLQDSLYLYGEIQSARTGYIASGFAGYISKLYVKVGQAVKQGDPIVLITQSYSSTPSKTEENYPIRANFNGIITSIQAREGQYVTATTFELDNNYIVRMDDTSHFFFSTLASESDLLKIKHHLKASISLVSLPQQTLEGEIEEISQAPKSFKNFFLSSSQKQYAIRIKILTKTPTLRPGLSANAQLILEKKSNVVTIPHEYILEENDGKTYAILENGEKTPIELGLRTLYSNEVIQGLTEGWVLLHPFAKKLEKE